ncbi:MAG: aldo/keto reductase [Lachnospiraceae bacterium]|jgi:predicted aldo/keto reductase-like oxidoreductase|nr:aldo/keto reductase [Lachnospiraceae bacterium]
MKFRELGKTGKSVSIIGLGLENVDFKPYEQVKETVDAGLEYGINIIDVFMPGTEVRGHIAKALGERRDQVMIQGHIGASNVNQQYDISRDMPTVKKFFEELLSLFGYIDFGMLFFIDSEDDYRNVFETEFAAYAEQLKKNGDIRHIGFSSHNPQMAIKAIETGLPEMMMFSVNPAFDMLPSDRYVFDYFGDEDRFGGEHFRGIDPIRAKLYKLCEQKEIGITVMKAFGAGKLLSPDHSPYATPLSVKQCIHYALTRPAVASVMAGSRTAAEVKEAVSYLEAGDEEKNYSQVISDARNDFRGSCVYCSHCQPCPAEIDIAAVIKYLDIARLDPANIAPSIRSHYHALSAKGGDCTSCGSCESRCPFGVEIIANMKEAEELIR